MIRIRRALAGGALAVGLLLMTLGAGTPVVTWLLTGGTTDGMLRRSTAILAAAVATLCLSIAASLSARRASITARQEADRG